MALKSHLPDGADKEFLTTRTIMALGGVSLLVSMGFSLINPALPTLVAEFSLSQARVSLLLTGAASIMAVASLIAGMAADRYGTAPILRLGLALFMAGSVIATCAANDLMLIGGRTVQAAGGAIALTASRLAVRKLFDSVRTLRILSVFALVMVAGSLPAAMIGGWITELGDWRLIFVLELAFASWIAFQLWRDRSNNATTMVVTLAPEHTDTLSLVTRLRSLLFLPFIILVLMHTASSALILAEMIWIPQIASSTYSLSPGEIGNWRTTLSVAMALGCLVPMKMAKPGSERWLAVLAGSISAVGLPIFFFAFQLINHPAALYLPASLLAFSSGIILALTPSWCMWMMPRNSGTAVGTMSLVVGLGSGALIQLVAGSGGEDVFALLIISLGICCAIEAVGAMALSTPWMARSLTRRDARKDERRVHLPAEPSVNHCQQGRYVEYTDQA